MLCKRPSSNWIFPYSSMVAGSASSFLYHHILYLKPWNSVWSAGFPEMLIGPEQPFNLKGVLEAAFLLGNESKNLEAKTFRNYEVQYFLSVLYVML